MYNVLYEFAIDCGPMDIIPVSLLQVFYELLDESLEWLQTSAFNVIKHSVVYWKC
jgi:hypothetical protein